MSAIRVFLHSQLRAFLPRVSFAFFAFELDRCSSSEQERTRNRHLPIFCANDRSTTVAANDSFRHEIDSYTENLTKIISISKGEQMKIGARTHILRVTPPIAALQQSTALPPDQAAESHSWNRSPNYPHLSQSTSPTPPDCA
jgi:hypothetical protein